MVKNTCILILALAISAQGVDLFVSKNGNDNNTGLSWDQSWLTLNKVNTAHSGGDSIYFGEGEWRGKLIVKAGTFSDRTLYSCSTGLELNHGAKIYGSNIVTDWIQYRDSVYKANYADDVDDEGHGGLLVQAETTVVFSLYDTANIDRPGEFTTIGDTIYACVFDLGSGYDPDNYTMEYSRKSIVHVNDGCDNDTSTNCSNDARWATIYGMHFSYAGSRMIDLINPEADSLFFINCKFTYTCIADSATNNPSFIYTANTTDELKEYILVKGCSLAYAHHHRPGVNHGDGITFYSVGNARVESCTFYGTFTADCINLKSGYDHQNPNNVIAFNLFDFADPGDVGHAIKIHEDQWNDSAYGNILINSDFYLSMQSADVDTLGRYFYVYNNTVVNGLLQAVHQNNVDVDYQRDKYFKYNLIYRSNASGDEIIRIHVEDTLTQGTDFDSNMYCIYDSVFRVGATDLNLTQWKAVNGYDNNSIFENTFANIYLDTTDGTRSGRHPNEPNPGWSNLFNGYGAKTIPRNKAAIKK